MPPREPVRYWKILGVSLAALALLLLAEIVVRGYFGEARPQVVINEIFYHAPNNENALEYVELYNASDRAVDLSGWAFLKGIQYKFPEGSSLDAGRYLVVCRDTAVFKNFYPVEPLGQFTGTLKNKGERLELADRHGKRVDSVKFDNRPPWPLSPDGVSASLERICPQVSGERWDNWGPSIMPLDETYPAGTPGEENTCFRKTLPPAVASVTFAPEIPAPDEPIRVEAYAHRMAHPELLYRIAGPGVESEETRIPMEWQGTCFVATIPGQDAGMLVRFRIQTKSEAGDTRFSPAEDDLRPAFSAYVTGPIEVGKIPVGLIINVGEAECKAAREQRNQPVGGLFGFGGPGGFGGPPPNFQPGENSDSPSPDGARVASGDPDDFEGPGGPGRPDGFGGTPPNSRREENPDSPSQEGSGPGMAGPRPDLSQGENPNSPPGERSVLGMGEPSPDSSPGGFPFPGGGFGGPPGGFFSVVPKPAQPPQGRSAFVYVDPATKKVELFDFVNISLRKGGRKVRFHQDRLLRGMKTVNMTYEGEVRIPLTETAGFELFRRAGAYSLRTDFIRLTTDGELDGYQLLFEQPNRSFLAQNKINNRGDLFKMNWRGEGLEGRHEKRTNPATGYADLKQLVEALESTKGEEQWKVIEQNFDVPQAVNYFAVSTLLSHWDGFFNNYYPYHDLEGSGKWILFPWDLDNTSGYYMGLEEGEVFYNMPLTFGMEGDQNPQGDMGELGMPMFWWRPGGFFSRPLLANPHFRPLFLKRLKELCTDVFVEEKFFPVFDEMRERLADEVVVRAKAEKQDPEFALERLDYRLFLLKEHLTKRRQFILQQDEIKALGE